MGKVEVLEKVSSQEIKPNFKEDIKLLWKGFFVETSMHGCSAIPKAQNHWLRRFLWLLFVITSATILVVYVVDFYSFYNTHPFITKSRVERVTSLPLPGLSICDSQYKKNLINNSNHFEEFGIAKYSSFVHAFGEFNVSAPSREEEEYMSYLPLEDFGMKQEDLILQASVNGRDIDVKSEFSSITSSFGRCFTFNNVRADGKGGDISLSDGGNLHMILNISQDSYFISPVAAGIYLIVHDPRDGPSPSSSGIPIPPGFMTIISLIPTKFKFLPKPYKSYGEEYCVESIDKTKGMKWHKEYTWFGCLEECMIIKVMNICDCRPKIGGFPEFVSYRICSVEELNGCIYAEISRVFDSIISQNDTSCDCPQPCESIQYDFRSSLMAFPSKSVADFLVKRGVASSYQDLRDNYMSVNIRFERMILNYVEHVPEIDAGDILGRLGGQMGLFLGASLLTLTELVERVFMSLLILGKAVLRPWSRLKVSTIR